jgi:hypothetical protein
MLYGAPDSSIERSAEFFATEGLAWLNTYPQEERVVRFVPVCAELTSHASVEFSSSRIADRLDEVINGRRGEQFSLTGVPAFIPRRLKDTLWEWLRDLDSYKMIIGGSSPMIETIDSLITSIGSSERPFGRTIELFKALLEARRITANELKRLIIGDIGGVLIPKPTLGSRELKRVEELNEMWIGIRLDHIKRIAKMASISKKISKNRPGSIIVATGKEKALILYEVIRLGLVNEGFWCDLRSEEPV